MRHEEPCSAATSVRASSGKDNCQGSGYVWWGEGLSVPEAHAKGGEAAGASQTRGADTGLPSRHPGKCYEEVKYSLYSLPPPEAQSPPQSCLPQPHAEWTHGRGEGTTPEPHTWTVL